MTFYIHLNCVSLLFVACIHPSGDLGVAVGVKRTRTLSLSFSLSLSLPLCACQPNCLALELLIIYWNRCVALRNQGGSWRRHGVRERERESSTEVAQLLAGLLTLCLSLSLTHSLCLCFRLCCVGLQSCLCRQLGGGIAKSTRGLVNWKMLSSVQAMLAAKNKRQQQKQKEITTSIRRSSRSNNSRHRRVLPIAQCPLPMAASRWQFVN